MKTGLVIAEFAAPYRVGVFLEMAKEYDLKIYFESRTNENRNEKWFCKSDELMFEVLDNETALEHFKKDIRNIFYYDFVIIYNASRKSAIKAILSCKLHHTPYFVNNDGAFIRANFIKDQIKVFLFRGAAGCFSGGKSATDYFLHYGVPKEKIWEHRFTSLNESDILKEPLTTDEKKTIRRELQIDDVTTFISVGQFIERKGFDVLLEAWREVVQPAHLIIVGGGDLQPAYENYIKNSNLKNVKIVGFMDKEMLFQYYKASDVFVLPTREDVWGLVINEAMAVGLPVITTERCNAGIELIENGINGYIVAVNNSEQLAEAMNHLLVNKEEIAQMANENIKKIQGCTIANIAARHIEAINEVI